MTTYLIEATSTGYRLAATNQDAIRLLQSGDSTFNEKHTLDEPGGHGIIERLYGETERTYHEARSQARSRA